MGGRTGGEVLIVGCERREGGSGSRLRARRARVQRREREPRRTIPPLAGEERRPLEDGHAHLGEDGAQALVELEHGDVALVPVCLVLLPEAKHDGRAGERVPDGVDEGARARAVPRELGVGEGALVLAEEGAAVEVAGVVGKVAQVLREESVRTRARKGELGRDEDGPRRTS